jgi:cellulose synthase/poly-beta-1,6-N-acetylglucosamine synthase-like glycosyltransferase
VSVLVPVRNEERFIEAMLEGLRGQELDAEIEFLLLDGRSTDATRSILDAAARADPRIRVIDNPGITIPRALNLGLHKAHGDVIVRMDAHCLYGRDFVATGLARLALGDVACVTARQVALGQDRWSRRVALALQTWLGTGSATFRKPLRAEREVDRGFCGVWRRSTLVELGGWDERFPVNEDAELAARLRERGGRIVLTPELAASYIPRSSLPALARQYLRYGFYRARTARRHPGSGARSHALAPGLVLTTVGCLVAPRAAARIARIGLGSYGTAVVLTSARMVGRSSARDAFALPSVFATMHFTWGIGFIAGWLSPLRGESKPQLRP